MKIFDSLVHPTITGSWLNSKVDCKFDVTVKHLQKNRIYKACAVGLADFEGYQHEKFIQECNKYDSLVPIAGFSMSQSDAFDEKQIEKIAKFGFKGIKLHPRFSNFSINANIERIINICRFCSSKDLVVNLCTYPRNQPGKYDVSDPYFAISEVLNSNPDVKMILLHGGTTNLLRYADLVRFNKSLLLDLSYTLMKYAGSSLDLDIQYLFNTFDRKICVGSDFPDFSVSDFLGRLKYFSRGVSKAKLENIYYKNLEVMYFG